MNVVAPTDSKVFSSEILAVDIHKEAQQNGKCVSFPWMVVFAQSLIIVLTLSAFALYVLASSTKSVEVRSSGSAFNVHVLEPRGRPSPPPSPYHRSLPPKWPSPSMQTKFRKAAVVSDNGICSEIGRKVLTSGGNAVDSTIATLICIGVTNPQSSGIGGGFFMTIYNASTGSCLSMNSRETAPMAAEEKIYQRDKTASVYGYKSIAVPGEINGLWRAFREFGSGRVPWSNLLMPSVQLCNEGIPVSEYLASILRSKEITESDRDPEFRRTFTNPSTGEYYKEGEIMKRPKLAVTLQALAEADDPSWLFYRGELAETIADEMASNGGLVTADDLADYESLVEPAMSAPITGELGMCGPPPPSGWPSTQAIVRTMAALYEGKGRREDLDSPDFYHYLLEAEKFGYALRSTLGDPQYVRGMDELVKNMTSPEYPKYMASKIKKDKVLSPEEYGFKFVKSESGTSHVSVIDEMGNAVACTSTVNLWLGSRVVSPSLGILWNDQMDGFSITGRTNQFGFEASFNNILQPGKTPVSSMSPTVVFNSTDKKVRMLLDTTGGEKIIQGVAVALIRALLFGETVKEAIDAPHVYSSIPYTAFVEEDFPISIREELKRRGHSVEIEKGMLSATHAIVVDNSDGYIYANCDKRSHVHMHPDGY